MSKCYGEILKLGNFSDQNGKNAPAGRGGNPVTSFDYSSSIIPAILTAWFMIRIEKLVEKITPAFTKNFLKPMLIILVSTPIAFLLLGPLGSFIGGGLAAALAFVQSHASMAAYGNLFVMYPMLIFPEEVEQIRRIEGEVEQELKEEGVPCRIPEQGIMIETPAAVMSAMSWHSWWISSA